MDNILQRFYRNHVDDLIGDPDEPNYLLSTPAVQEAVDVGKNIALKVPSIQFSGLSDSGVALVDFKFRAALSY